ncbi:MAG: carboxypeptidase regulatory-like domain-containing protein [Bacteroidetes bacterium]|nr:carboxypeptidase regulatory-like domain-containing protein [Bacteroidota bacterium]
MVRSLRYLFLLLFISAANIAFAQSGGIAGRITDEKGEPMIGALIKVTAGGLTKGGAQSDEDGNYVIKPLSPGNEYEVEVRYPNYQTNKTTGIIVIPDKDTKLDIGMEQDKSKDLKTVVVKTYKKPLISDRETRTAEEIEKLPTRSTNAVVSTTAGVYQATDNGAVSLGGARSDGTAYIIDGVRVYGSRGTNLSQNSVDQIEVLQSGLSAKYGDALGGVVSITTKGVSKDLHGGILLEKSVDGYGHNLVNFNLSGPLYKQKITSGRDSGIVKPKLGFRLDGDFYYDKDRNPAYYGTYKIKDEKLKEIQDRPLVSVPNQNGVPVFKNASEFTRLSDFDKIKQRQNADIIEGRLNARLDLAATDNLQVTAGGTVNYSRSKAYSSAYVFSPDAVPVINSYTARGYLRFTQNFRKPVVAGEEKKVDEKKPLISNAYYTVQADYQKEYQSTQNPDYGKDIFKYAYVGKFYTDYASVYAPGVDDSSGKTGIKLYADHVPTKVRYERSEMNPILANYTTQYFNEVGTPITSPTFLASQGYMNGSTPSSTYGLFTNVGTAYTSYSYASVDQYAVNVEASFDLQPKKTRHAIEFGLYYQQQVMRGYSAGGNLWQQARLLTNKHLVLNTADPRFIVNGKEYNLNDVKTGVVSPSPFDTIYYNRVDTGNQSTFDKNLRTKLGLSTKDTRYLDVDNYDPSMLSLDMFSADELLNNGNAFVNYYGYDYLGNKQKGQVNFQDFFSKKDANGNYTRDIGAFRPSYISGYLLDRFDFKDISFNIGVRVERYDANTKVLKDPYSLYELRNVGNVLADAKYSSTLTRSMVPGNIKDDYVVYVNNNQSATPKVIGYRNGDDWYDPNGKYIEDPSVLKNYSGGLDPQPMLTEAGKVNIDRPNFDSKNSFTDYKPQVNVVPRIAFQFNITDQALFFAHYDVRVQRPPASISTPDDYYFLTANNQGLINNPNLKPQKMFDYEAGFKQKLTNSSAISITGFYKERKDMIQARSYLYAWPVTYFTYGNRDFSTTKGLTLSYDLRRVNHLRMTIAYTLQFAEGTGSSSSTTIRGGVGGSGILSQFTAAGLPNLRYSTVLDYDSRHLLVTTIDYRFEDGDGPMVGKKHILENAGVNFIFRARSGEPYTKFTQPVQNGNQIQGGVNGSRLPWHYGLDMKVDKNFKLSFLGGKHKDGTNRTTKYLNAYVLVNNLLNIRDVLGVNGYTGRTDDDGYLNSPQGQVATQSQTNPASYIDLYNMSLRNGANVNLPRRINLGVQLTF